MTQTKSSTVKVDRRRTKDRRTAVDRRTKSEPVKNERRKLERRKKVSRRRQIDPTTCERDYSGEEVEFMQALDQYKRSSGRMFPTCSEILEVIHKLGYVRMPAAVAEQATEEVRAADGVQDLPGPPLQQPAADSRDP